MILIRCAAYHDCECARLRFLIRSEVRVGRCEDGRLRHGVRGGCGGVV